MDKLEKAELVREKTGVSFEEAREALEACDYDVLDAIVWLEQSGKTTGRTASYTTMGAGERQASYEMSQAQSDYEQATKKSGMSAAFRRIGSAISRLFKRSLEISFTTSKDGKQIASVPLLLLVVLMFFAFWIVIPALIVGLFFGFKYRFDGLGSLTLDVNDMASKASEGAEALRRDVMGDGKSDETSAK